MPLQPTAKKEAQIAFINGLELAVEALIEFAQGNEAPLNELVTTRATAPLVPTTDDAVSTAFAHKIESGISSLPAKREIAASDKCVCVKAVKDKDSATQLCILCGKNAYENHYAFAHTDEGKQLIAAKQSKNHPVLPGIVLLPLPIDAAFGQWPVTEDDDEAVYGAEAS